MTPSRREPLQEVERSALNRVVGTMRGTLTRELSRVLEGTFGIKAGPGEPEDQSRLSLGPDELEARRELIDLWHAFGRRADLLVREAAFTHTNRLIAIRVAEAIGLLPESLARGRRSSGYRQLLEVAPLLGSDDDAGYWEYLQLCGDELAHDVPRLFDPRNPLLALRPPPSAIDGLVELLSADDLGLPSRSGCAWAAPDTFGWTYQFFNSDDERSEMRRTHPQPIDSWELAVRNQFFTPEYVVGFLVHNSLGRRLVEAGFQPLVNELEYLVDLPIEQGEPIELGDTKVLDPACGSGHFLLGAFDVLERAWSLRGVEPRDAAPAIIRSLWGIDIDARAAQVAAAAIIFRARRDSPDGDLPTPNIVCARAIPGSPAARAELLASVDPSRQVFLAELMDQLDRAPELGSLLKVDELIRGETARLMTFGGGRQRATRRRSKANPNELSLVDAGIQAGTIRVDTVVDEVLAIAQAAADDVTSTPTERVLAAAGGDSLRLVKALSHQYDAVLMNPPFGEPIPRTKPYLKAAYPWLPTKDANLFAAFVGRGLELCKADGYLGAITSRAGLFLTTFQAWREEVVLGNDLIVLADLGHKVMHDALVEAAAYVIRPGNSRHRHPSVFIRLTRQAPEGRPAALRDACTRLRMGLPDKRVFMVAPQAFDVISGSPMAYWISDDIRRCFSELPPIGSGAAEIRPGLSSGNDFRFVRAFWEVHPSDIARSESETFTGKRWAPFAKGGEYSPFWFDIHLVVDWEKGGMRIRESDGSAIRNPRHYFEHGLTYPRRTASGFSPRVLPNGCVFADKGPAVVACVEPLAMLGWLASRAAGAMLAVQLGAADETSGGGASKSYEAGLVAKLPWPSSLEGDSRFVDLVRKVTLTRRGYDVLDETARGFIAPWPAAESSVRKTIEARLRTYEDEVLSLVDLTVELEAVVLEAAGLTEAEDFIEQEMGQHPGNLPRNRVSVPEIMELFSVSLERLIEFATQRRGALRVLTQKNFVADRRIEILAHTFQVHPKEVVEVRRSTGIIPPEFFSDAVESIVSFLVGVAFGRWDATIGRDPSTAQALPKDPFAPVPLCPPGMLVASDGLPVRASPAEYPLDLVDYRVLVDEPGHSADLVACTEAAARILVDDPVSLINELAALLGVVDLRTYLRRRFFRDHLSRYSKSRRKAPIYWPLTTASRAWTVWVYAPTLSREAIYSVAAHAERRLNAAEVEIRRVESAQLQASVPGAATHDAALARSLAVRLDSERRLSEELRAFRRVVARVAESGWAPDINDGIVLCAAPFAEVFPDWPKDLTDTRKQLRAGKFPWSSIHHARNSL